MIQNPVISISQLGKAYRIWKSPEARLTTSLMQMAAPLIPSTTSWRRSLLERASASFRDFWALRDLSFEVHPGESIGVIGRNGSGKSTLLQIIAGTMQPSVGQVKVKGRVAALLELGSGFNPDFTGRENVFLNASILGLTRAETVDRFDAIAAFADIGDYIDQPVKTYSSGMMVRLAFAVAISIDPDILIVDEALSVGDVFFQQRCFTRIHELLDRGTTLFLVTHDLAAVQNLCSRAILLDRGRMSYIGAPEECVSRYYATHGAGLLPAQSSATVDSTVPSHSREEALLRANILPTARSRHGERLLELVAARVAGHDGQETRQVDLQGELRVEVLLKAHADISHPACGIHLFDRMNNLVFAAGTPQLGIRLPALRAGQQIVLVFALTMSIQPGPYTFSLAAGEPHPVEVNVGRFDDFCEGLGPIEVIAPTLGVWPFYGIAKVPMKIEVHLE